MEKIIDLLKKYTDGKQNTEKVEISVLQLNRIIKVLDQGSALDKISAEIRHFMYDVNPYSSESDYACDYILNIIDKYKAEGESRNEVN